MKISFQIPYHTRWGEDVPSCIEYRRDEKVQH